MSIKNILSMDALRLLIDSRVKANEFTYNGNDTEFTLSFIHENTAMIAVEAECVVDMQIEDCSKGGHFNEYYFSDIKVTAIKYQSILDEHTVLYQSNPVELARLNEPLVEILNAAELYDFYDEYGNHVEFSNMHSAV